MALRVIIADDEPAARERLRHLLAQEIDVQIVAECDDGSTAVAAIRQYLPDLVFLDIRMPALNGFEVIRQLDPQSVPSVIFVSAHRDHALQAFEVPAVDYLLKPFDQTRFQRALRVGREAVQRRRTTTVAPSPTLADTSLSSESTKERLAVRSSGKITLINYSDIVWFKGAGNYIEVRVDKKIHLLRETLSSMERKLPASFARISKTYIVNLHCIREIKAKSHGDGVLTLNDGTQLIVTRSYRQALRSRLKL